MACDTSQAEAFLIGAGFVVSAVPLRKTLRQRDSDVKLDRFVCFVLLDRFVCHNLCWMNEWRMNLELGQRPAVR
jgi:hypothetical protein